MGGEVQRGARTTMGELWVALCLRRTGMRARETANIVLCTLKFSSERESKRNQDWTFVMIMMVDLSCKTTTTNVNVNVDVCVM